MKKKISKIEIVTYLKDFCKLKNYIISNPQLSFYECFKMMLFDEGRGQFAYEQYYIDMILVYSFFLVNRKFSFMSDVLFDYLLEENMANINIPEHIFVNKSDKNRFSKKKILKFIRNALNHNDNNNRELYNIYIDNSEIKIEIFLKNVKPIPFHIEITISEYLKIMRGFRNANKLDLTCFKTTDTLDFKGDLFKELDKIFYRRFYFKHKVNSTVRNELKKKIYEDEEELKRFLEEEDISFKDFKLSLAQKMKIMEELDFFKEYAEMNESISIDSIVATVVPLGIVKNDLINFEIAIIKNYLFCDKCYTDICNDAKNLYLNYKDKNNPLYDYNYGKENNIELLLRVLNLNAFNNLSLSIYYGYLFDTLITDEFVSIGSKYYLRKKIRNAFVHGRWFNGIFNCFCLYDYDNDSEFDYNWSSVIDDEEFKMAAEKYYSQLSNENKNDIFFNYPLHLNLTFDDKLKSMTYTKDGVSYIFNLDVESYHNKDFITWGLYTKVGNDIKFVDSFDDSKKFFDEILDIVKKEQFDLEKLILFFYYQNLLCIGYKRGILSLNELQKNDNYYSQLIDFSKETDNSKKL